MVEPLEPPTLDALMARADEESTGIRQAALGALLQRG